MSEVSAIDILTTLSQRLEKLHMTGDEEEYKALASWIVAGGLSVLGRPLLAEMKQIVDTASKAPIELRLVGPDRTEHTGDLKTFIPGFEDRLKQVTVDDTVTIGQLEVAIAQTMKIPTTDVQLATPDNKYYIPSTEKVVQNWVEFKQQPLVVRYKNLSVTIVDSTTGKENWMYANYSFTPADVLAEMKPATKATRIFFDTTQLENDVSIVAQVRALTNTTGDEWRGLGRKFVAKA
ncbi:Hypothetical protein POVN_LOCUS679 [uncultured virus]|nr:Hypothetical protein POVN_LOCUS679 [uncultured virus]